MTVYTSAALSPSARPNPMETVYQLLPVDGEAPAGARRGDLSLADRLFGAAIVAIRREERYGAVTWGAQALGTSRQTIYDIAAAIQRRSLEVRVQAEPAGALPILAHRVGANDLARSALTLLFPGRVALRPMGVCLEAGWGTSRCPAWLSTFLNYVGRRASQVIERTDCSAAIVHSPGSSSRLS